MKELVKKKIAAGLSQIHHVIQQKYFTHNKYGPFLKKLGFENDELANVIPLPTKEGLKKGVAKPKVAADGSLVCRATHNGGHTEDYATLFEKKMDDLIEAVSKKELTELEAAEKLRAFQKEMKDKLRSGEVKVHGEEFRTYLSLMLLGSSKEEIEDVFDAVIEWKEQMLSEAMDGNALKHGRAAEHTGDQGWLGWLGFSLDLFNPLDDAATISDGLIWLDYDPIEESPEDYRRRKDREALAAPWHPGAVPYIP